MLIPPGLPPCTSARLAIEGHVEGYETWRGFEVVKRYTNAFVWDPENKKVLLGYKKRGFGKGMYNGFGGKVDPGETALQAGVRELQEEAGIDAPLEPCGVLFFVGEGGAFAHHITVFRATSFTGTIAETDEMRPEWFAFPTTPTPDPGLNPDSAGVPLNSDPDSTGLSGARLSSIEPSIHSSLDTALSDPNNLNPPNLNPIPSHTHTSNPDSAKLPPFPYTHMWKDDPLWVPLLLSNTPFIGRVDYGPIDNGKEADSGMQRWWIASVEPEEFKVGRVWEV